MRLRPYHPDDRAALADICLRTGDDGGDATHLLREPALLPTVYLHPFLELAPDLATVLTIDDDPVGYVVGVADTLAFEAECERRWWPAARERYPLDPGAPSRDAALLRLVHEPEHTPADLARRYPAHLHVDLLPEAQGRGGGRRLLEHLFDQLRARGVPGVHLGVAAANTGARSFYARLGFTVLEADDDGALMVRGL